MSNGKDPTANGPAKKCEPPCEPLRMNGMSWWKNLGYNSPCGCAHVDAEAGMVYMAEGGD